MPAVTMTPKTLYPGGTALLKMAGRASAWVVWEGKRIPLTPLPGGQACGAFLPLSVDAVPGQRKAELWAGSPGGAALVRRIPVEVMPREFPVQRLTLPESKVTLGKVDMKRHHREREEVRQALSGLTSERRWQNPFRRPVPGTVSTPFGFRRVLNDKPRSPHSGVDLRGKERTPVAVAGDGLVVLTGDHFFAGRCVYVDHGMGIVTLYFHLSEISVSAGETVRAGQTIGRIGTTGRSTGPHLHWGVRLHGVNVDPLSFLTLFENS